MADALLAQSAIEQQQSAAYELGHLDARVARSGLGFELASAGVVLVPSSLVPFEPSGLSGGATAPLRSPSRSRIKSSRGCDGGLRRLQASFAG